MANVVEKWDFCHQKLKETEEKPENGFKNVCVCYEKDPSRAPDDALGNYK